jgi:4-oxalocrotonate tautomerase
MPFVEVNLMEGAIPSAERQELIRRVTDAVVSIYGEGIRPVTWVVIKDVKSGEWGIGGNLVTVADVHEMMKAKVAR